jgi:hypothetical protein
LEMPDVTSGEWRHLPRLLLSQRLEINAIESAITIAGILTSAQIKSIRTQAMQTAKAWSSEESDDVLKLLGIHASADATMGVPLRDSGNNVVG